MPRMPTWKSLVLEFLQEQLEEQASKNTLAIKATSLRSAWEWIEETDAPQDPRKWTGIHFREYRESISHLSENTQLNYLKNIRQFLKWAGMKKADKLRINITAERTHVDWLTEEQVSYVISRVTNSRLRAAIILMASLGLRREETVTIKISDMHDTWVHVRGKGCKARNIPISKHVWAMLEPYLAWRRAVTPPDSDKDVFLLSQNKRRFTPGSLASSMRGTMKKKFPFHFSAHTFRRTYGRLMYFAGCSLVKLKTWMGHETLEMTIRYLGIEYQDPTEGGQYIPRYML